jgi:hypothetical protein
LGCTVWKGIGSLGVEKHVGMKLSKEWVNNDINFFSETQQQLTSLHKKYLTTKKVHHIKLHKAYRSTKRDIRECVYKISD